VVKTQYSKTSVSVQSAAASTTDDVAEKEKGGTPRARLGSEPVERSSMEQNNILEPAEKTRTDVRQVRGVVYTVS